MAPEMIYTVDPPSHHNAGMFVECFQSLTEQPLLPGLFVALPTLQPLPSQIGTIQRASLGPKNKVR